MTTTTIGDNTGYTVGIVDSHIQQNTPNTNFGTVASFNCQSATSGQITRAVMKFNGLSTVTGPVTVSSAVLTLRNRDAAASSRVIEIRRLLNSFDELQVTWNNRLTGVSWSTAGIKGGSDVNDTVIATGTLPTTSETNVNITNALFTQYVQDVINGTYADYGILISVVDDSTVFDAISRRIGAKDNASGSIRPYLTVTYTTVTQPTISISDSTTTNLSGEQTFTVTLSSSYASPITVDYATSNDTATAGIDYTAISGTLTFTPGDTTRTITVPILP